MGIVPANMVIVFWLDGHWSGGVTAGEDDECPLLDELGAIKHRRGDIIMIDDARLFLAAPPISFDPSQWPTVFEIAEALGEYQNEYLFQMFHDIIFLVPNQQDIVDCTRDWARKHARAIGTRQRK